MEKRGLELATFGAGCFWGVEELYRTTKGVVKTDVGYEGGKEPAAGKTVTYEDVCSDETGHAEVVQVQYHPSLVSYEDLLKIFWENHDPITENRQGPDMGTQYRSVIFYHTPWQKKLAEESKANLEKSDKFKYPIVTQIVPAQTFHRAEEYHQQYLAKQGLSTCHI